MNQESPLVRVGVSQACLWREATTCSIVLLALTRRKQAESRLVERKQTERRVGG